MTPKVYAKLVTEKNGSLTLVVDPTKPSWAIVNTTGARVLELCDGKRNVDDIAAEIAIEYDIDLEQAAGDIRSVIDTLADAKIVSFEDKEDKQVMPEYQVKLKTLYFELTSNCNLNCIHCFAAINGAAIMPIELAKKAINDLADLGGGKIILSGGEPLLYPWLKELIGFGEKRALKVSLITNGTLIDQDFVALIAETNVSVQISIDGASAEVNDKIRGAGSFEIVMRNVKTMIESGLGERMALSMTPSQINCDQVNDFMDMATSIGVPNVHFSHLFMQGRAESNWPNLKLSVDQQIQLHEELEAARSSNFGPNISGNWCDTAKRMLTYAGMKTKGCTLGEDIKLGINGNLYPCVKLVGDEFILGNLKNNTIAEIFDQGKLAEIRDQMYSRVETIEKCCDCAWRYFCGGGCMGEAYGENDTIWTEDSLCRIRPYFFKKLIYNKVGETYDIKT